MNGPQWNHKIFNVGTEDFAPLALEIFRHQAAHTPVYAGFLRALQVDSSHITGLPQIPFLPIRFFKTEEVIGEGLRAERIFESSGTGGGAASRHLVADLSLYETSFLKGFARFYGPPQNWCILGLLPSYLERGNSSLVHMVNELAQRSGHPDSGFYLDDLDRLARTLRALEAAGTQTLLVGVSFALLDLAERFPQPLTHTVVMETGGMKGKREELVREDLHQRLSSAFGIDKIHSEYGMTELLSQAYSSGDGLFHSPPWMRVLLRDEEDPLTLRGEAEAGRAVSGAINVIDLANIHSCSFIATDDVGRLHPGGSFEVLGRMDGSDLRGCSLLTI